MASMILASSPLSAQSFVKLRTNSNYSHSPCFVSRVKNSYVHLPYKNISHIESSKSLFVKGDSNFSFSSPKFPRYSPSLNVIKACYASNTNVYGFYAHEVNTGENFELGDIYKGDILLIVNLPQQISSDPDESKNEKLEIEFLNDLRNLYTNKRNSYGGGHKIILSLPNKWKELSKEDKDAALIRCQERFDINLDEHYVKDSCEDILKNRSRQWRYKLKQQFESARSEEEARKIEVTELTPENWNRLCDMWINPEHKKRCDINKVNRAKLKTNHFMGSKAFVAARAEMGETNPEGMEPDRIEFYKHTYYTNEKGWSSEEAETNYKNMKDLKDLYTSGESSMTIDEIVDTVLGAKSGYIKGLGYGPKPNTIRATQRRATELEDSLKKAKQEAATIQHDLQKRLNAAETVVENQQSQIEDQQSRIQEQQSQIQALNSQLDTVVARQEEMFKKMQLFVPSPPSSGH